MKPHVAPMGWNSWDCYGAAVTEDIVKQNADFMAASHEYRPFAELCMRYGAHRVRKEWFAITLCFTVLMANIYLPLLQTRKNTIKRLD